MLANKHVLCSLYKHIRAKPNCNTLLISPTSIYVELQRNFPKEFVDEKYNNNINVIYRSWNHLTEEEKKNISTVAKEFGYVEN